LSGLLLVDTSAYARGFRTADFDDQLCMCPISRLEILYAARSQREYDAIDGKLAEFRSLRIDAQTMAGALSAQRTHAARGLHRVPIPDLLIAACAQQHGADVLHVDRHYDVLAQVMDFRPVRLPAS
jgi:predicted nucleic acid-binding protein